MASTTEDYSTITKLKSTETFHMWRFQVSVLLKAIPALGICEGTKKKDDCTTQNEKSAWEQNDAKAQKAIMYTIDKTLLPHIMTCQNSEEMWSTLTTLFENKGEERKASLMQEFFNFKPKKNQKISDILNDLSSLFARMKALDTGMKDELLTNKILTSLPDGYNNFVTAWKLTGKTSLNDLMTNLISEENREEIKTEEHVAFTAGPSKDLKCFRCNLRGHIKRNCRVNLNSRRRNQNANKDNEGTDNWSKGNKKTFPKCEYCKKQNHPSDRCFF